MNNQRARHHIIPVFIPHKGCSHDCIFCNQKRISGVIEPPACDDVRQIINDHRAVISRGNNARTADKLKMCDLDMEVAFYGGSFTGLPISEQETYLRAATDEKLKIRLSTRPDFINDEIIELLSRYKVGMVELGVQSMNDEVLRLSGRGHTSADVRSAVGLLKNAGLDFGIQLMPGLPGDSFEISLETTRQVIELKPSVVRIYPTLVIKDTALCDMFEQGNYTPLTLEEAVNVTSVMMDMFEETDTEINVIRVGLQPTENIRLADNEGDVVAGPFHPAFRQLVNSERVYTKVIKQFKARDCGTYLQDLGIHIKIDDENKIITVKSDVFSVSDIIGQKRHNAVRINEETGYRIVAM